jgi:glycosyltransferase involved in cell wall biosynthesis
MLANHELNIVSFNVPYPPNYGGVIDVFYKIKALHNIGVKIHLHCFKYGRSESIELENYCTSVTYYSRQKSIFQLFSSKPFIVETRMNENLLKNLTKNGFPVLFEGLHTSAYIEHFENLGIKTMLRAHNVEHLYYNSLGRLSNSYLKKIFFYLEAAKLKKHESLLSKKVHIAAISPGDYSYFQKQFSNVILIPAFHPNNEVISQMGNGTYFLYQADLSIQENSHIAMKLIKLSDKMKLPLIIAGKDPDKKLIYTSKKHSNVILEPNISSERMQELISNAHAHILPSIQSNGVKLKLLAALYQGRHVVANKIMLQGSGLEGICHIANTDTEYVNTLNSLVEIPFTQEEIIKRSANLNLLYNNALNADIIFDYFWK